MALPPFVKPFGLEDKIAHMRKRVEEAELRADLHPEDVSYQLALDARRVELAILEHALEVKLQRESVKRHHAPEAVIEEELDVDESDDDDDIDIEVLEKLLEERARVRARRERRKG